MLFCWENKHCFNFNIALLYWFSLSLILVAELQEISRANKWFYLSVMKSAVKTLFRINRWQSGLAHKRTTLPPPTPHPLKKKMSFYNSSYSSESHCLATVWFNNTIPSVNEQIHLSCKLKQTAWSHMWALKRSTYWDCGKCCWNENLNCRFDLVFRLVHIWTHTQTHTQVLYTSTHKLRHAHAHIDMSTNVHEFMMKFKAYHTMDTLCQIY